MIPLVWLPGMKRIAPLSSVTSPSAIQHVTRLDGSHSQ